MCRVSLLCVAVVVVVVWRGVLSDTLKTPVYM